MKHISIIPLAAVVMLAASCAAARKSDVRLTSDESPELQTAPVPTRYARRSFRLMTYNVGAFSKYEESGIDEVARIISAQHPIAVALNEVDSVNVRHKEDQLALLSSALGDWQPHFGAAMVFLGGSYGNGVVVSPKCRIVRKCVIPLDRAGGSEPRSVAVVETDDFVFASCHLDFKSESAQLSQIEQLTAWFKDNYEGSRKPVFMCGDMNATPDSGSIRALKQDWEQLSPSVSTFPIDAPCKCIDYIFRLRSSARVTVTGGEVVTSEQALKASDHLPVWVEVVVCT